MEKYLLIWEMDWSRIPVDPKERAAATLKMLNMTKQDMEKGLILDWGAFLGEGKGYAIGEGTHAQINMTMQKYMPFVMFKLYPVSTVAQTEEVMKAVALS